ncbi:hypothetical protein Clo1100_1154 [Clostridium sp. BNL1100]|nr:hypothetical protein Clo1100_1154 [Clostridium sp. BNL1100]
MIQKKSWIKQLFCKHNFVQAKKASKYESISGERIYIVCEHCGKVNSSYYREYEGMGYK